jgi:prepilin-type N-terminal cleavage/methylation domain-containing protein
MARLSRTQVLAQQVHPSHESGLSMLELLITISILGIGVSALIGGLGNTLSFGTRAKQASDVTQVLTRVTQELQNAPWECDAVVPNSSFSTLLGSLRPTADWSIQVINVESWGKGGARSFGSGCPTVPNPPAIPGDASSVYRTVKLTVRITSPNALSTRTVDVVKRP